MRSQLVPAHYLGRCPACLTAAEAPGSDARVFVFSSYAIVYRAPMSRMMCLSIVLALSLMPVAASAAPVKTKPVTRWHGYGFLPGYHQPPSNSLPPYMQEGALRREARTKKLPWTIDPTPQYYGWDGDWHYFGRPGFYRGQYNGGSFGPCYTRTPIGPIWNCG